ncbi:hypothetical protein [Maribacter sp. LLG6340-A2]|uniref:hypothetical protein n=1 Tax=Maribacter sp. LLG6340-A2 TaxID=3160834 RepID=UPI0038697C63
MKISIAIFLLFFLTCQKDDVFDDTPIDQTGLVGEWLLTETYISPGGKTEWKKVNNGYRYLFKTDGSYNKISITTESGNYDINESELFLYVGNAGEKDTLGFNANFNEAKTVLTLSPSYPNICIEGCLYRYQKQ